MLGLGVFSDMCGPVKLQMIMFMIIIFCIVIGILGGVMGESMMLAGAFIVGIPALLVSYGLILGVSSLCRGGRGSLAWALSTSPFWLTSIAVLATMKRDGVKS